MATGVFIALEGGEGAGKDTQIEILKARPELADAVFTREPGGTEAGNEIRSLVLSDRSPALNPHAELFLFLAARAELMAQVVRPALRAGKVVISNRFALSTYAYQIYARKQPELLPILSEASKSIIGEDKPHYIFLDLPPEEARRRVLSRDVVTRFDAENLDFYASVREGYLKHLRDGVEHAIIGTDRPIENVSADVWKTISSWL